MAPGAQEEEDPDESGCEEEEGREDEDEDSGSEESLVDSDSDPEAKGAWRAPGLGAPSAPCSLLAPGPRRPPGALRQARLCPQR